MYPSILGSFVGFCAPLSACQPPFLLRGREAGAREERLLRVGGGDGDCLGGGGGISARGGWGLRARGGGDFGAGRKSILWAFFGACARFWVAGGVDYRKNHFAVVRALKRLFDSARPKVK